MAVIRRRHLEGWNPLVDHGWITNRTGETERRGEVDRFGETTRGGRRMTVCLVPGPPFYSFCFCFSFAVVVVVGFLFAVHFASGRCLFESPCVRMLFCLSFLGWEGGSASNRERMEGGEREACQCPGVCTWSDSTGSALVWHSKLTDRRGKKRLGNIYTR